MLCLEVKLNFLHSLIQLFHGQRSLVGYSPQGHKKPDTTELLTTPSNVLCRQNIKKERKEGKEGGREGFILIVVVQKNLPINIC